MRFGIAHAYMGTEEYKKAKKEILLALKINDTDPQAYNSLGIINDSDGNHIEAIEAYQNAIKLDPNNPETHLSLGMSYSDIKKYNEAIDSFKKSIAILPDQETALFMSPTAKRSRKSIS